MYKKNMPELILSPFDIATQQQMADDIKGHFDTRVFELAREKNVTLNNIRVLPVTENV